MVSNFSVENKKILITGGAGFIGSNMVRRLLPDNEVTVLDDLSGVDRRYIEEFEGNRNFKFIKDDINSIFDIQDAINFDLVIHLAANSDVRNGSIDPSIDFKSNTQGTFNVLEFMRRKEIPEIMFSSSSTVYGETDVLPTPEDYGPYMPISSYGASKISGEGFIFAYSHYYGIRGSVFRFANIVGRNSTHGVIHDFINKLMANKKELEILGDGTQRKSYMHVDDCVGSMIYVHSKIKKTDVVNLGNSGVTSVRTIADTVTSQMGLHNVKYVFTGGVDGRGWKGDVKVAQLDIKKLEGMGWKNEFTSDEAVIKATAEILEQRGISKKS